MKAVVAVNSFGGKVTVDQGDTTITGDYDFSVTFQELANPDILEIFFQPGKPFTLRLTQSGGRIVSIRPDVYNEGFLVITRYRHPDPENSGQPLQDKQYLTKDLKWVPEPEPKTYGPSPEDALRVPIIS